MEIALEMCELEEFHLKIEENIKTKEKKRPGRPKKSVNDDKNQIKIETFFNNKKYNTKNNKRNIKKILISTIKK